MNARGKKSPPGFPVLCCLFSLVIFAGCQTTPPSTVPTPTSTRLPTLTPSPTHSLTPTTVPVFTIQNVDDLYPPVTFLFDPAFTNLQSGTYLIFNGNYYFSLDGLRWGRIGQVGTANPDILVYFYGAQYPYMDDLNDLANTCSWTTGYPQIAEVFICSFNLSKGWQHVWKAIFQPESGMTCYDVTLSPNYKWMSSDCWKDGERYLYFLNIQNGRSSLLHSTEFPCLSVQTAFPNRWDYYSWSPDGKWLSATCTDGSHAYMSCLVSPETGEFYCPQPAGWYVPEAWSPDSSMVALYVQVEQGRDLLITDISCLKNAQTCPEHLRVSVSSPSNPAGFLGGVAWDWSGERVVWSTYDFQNFEEGYASIWTADLMTGEISSIAGSRGANVEAVSPDGEWIVIYYYQNVNDNGLILLSKNGQILRRLPEAWDGGAFGWLVIP